MSRQKGDDGIDDSERLERVADIMLAKGCRPTEAARDVVTAELGEGNSYINASISRLLRKVRREGVAKLLREAERRAATAAGTPLRARNPTIKQTREHARQLARNVAIVQKLAERANYGWQEFVRELEAQGGHPKALDKETIKALMIELAKGPLEE